MILHARDAYLKGYRKVLISANDTDVVVIAVAVVSALEGLELWVTFGRGQNIIYIPTHEIARKLGHQRSWGLLFLHAITGCDTVSAFNGIGKKTAWDVWTGMPHLWPLFQKLASAPVSVSEADIEEIERFVVVMYSRTSPAHTVNDARKQLVANNNRQIENISPTKAALFEHTKIAVYQAYCVILSFHLLDYGVGKKKMDSGFPSGQHFPKHVKPVVN